MTTSFGSSRLRRAAHDERGSMPFLVLVILLTTSLGAVLMSTVVAQSRTAQYDTSRVRSVDAAQAGIDYALSRIRSAVSDDDASVGDAGDLPCPGTDWSNLTVATGDKLVAGTDARTTPTFDVTVTYFSTQNPAQLSDTARDSAKMPVCSSSDGPYDPVASNRVPRWALIKSTGRDGTKNSRARTLETTYVVQTNDVNISGGQIRLYATEGDPLCMEADGNPAPVAGSQVRVQTCDTSSPPRETQMWSYRSDLSLMLAGSGPTKSNPTGQRLCMDTSSSSHAANVNVVLKVCAVDKPTTANKSTWKWFQQWSINDYAHFEGALTNQDNTDGWCMSAAAPEPTRPVQLQTCTLDKADTRQAFVPTPTAGAGGAGKDNQQLVNYAQFATCLDVTEQDPGSDFLILYTCKQNPNTVRINWNQRLRADTTGDGPTTTMLRTTVRYQNGTTADFCLWSPQSAYKYPVNTGDPSNLVYPRLRSCPSTRTDPFSWTVSQRYSNSAKTVELPYADRYTIKDKVGLCLGLGSTKDYYRFVYLKLVMSSCNGSTSQKWNADPSTLKGSLTNTRERYDGPRD